MMLYKGGTSCKPAFFYKSFFCVKRFTIFAIFSYIWLFLVFQKFCSPNHFLLRNYNDYRRNLLRMCIFVKYTMLHALGSGGTRESMIRIKIRQMNEEVFDMHRQALYLQST